MKQPNKTLFTRTDLAIESSQACSNADLSGISHQETITNGVKITSTIIDNPITAQQLHKPCGKYCTIEPTDFQVVPPDFEEESDLVAEQIRKFLPAPLGSALVVGLGNAQITPDALGPQVINHTIATRHLPQETLRAIGLEGLSPVSALAPGVLGQTGLESAEIIHAICKNITPDVVIVIDALASKSLARLGKTIQLSDSGIAPGSGVLNHRKTLSQDSLGVPVLAIGVPTVVDLRTIAEEYAGMSLEQNKEISQMMVTPREIDLLIEHAAKLIGYAINKALQPMLRTDDIAALVS